MRELDALTLPTGTYVGRLFSWAEQGATLTYRVLWGGITIIALETRYGDVGELPEMGAVYAIEVSQTARAVR
jgi:hypothetical protein